MSREQVFLSLMAIAIALSFVVDGWFRDGDTNK